MIPHRSAKMGLWGSVEHGCQSLGAIGCERTQLSLLQSSALKLMGTVVEVRHLIPRGFWTLSETEPVEEEGREGGRGRSRGKDKRSGRWEETVDLASWAPQTKWSDSQADLRAEGLPNQFRWLECTLFWFYEPLFPTVPVIYILWKGFVIVHEPLSQLCGTATSYNAASKHLSMMTSCHHQASGLPAFMLHRVQLKVVPSWTSGWNTIWLCTGLPNSNVVSVDGLHQWNSKWGWGPPWE